MIVRITKRGSEQIELVVSKMTLSIVNNIIQEFFPGHEKGALGFDVGGLKFSISFSGYIRDDINNIGYYMDYFTDIGIAETVIIEIPDLGIDSECVVGNFSFDVMGGDSRVIKYNIKVYLGRFG